MSGSEKWPGPTPWWRQRIRLTLPPEAAREDAACRHAADLLTELSEELDLYENAETPDPERALQELREKLAGEASVPEAPAPAEPPLPPGVLGYLVGMTEDGEFAGTTHTSAMSLEEARREAKAHGTSQVRQWFPVELREVPR